MSSAVAVLTRYRTPRLGYRTHWLGIHCFSQLEKNEPKKKQTFPHCKSWIRMLYTNHGKIRCGSESTWSRSASSITGTSLFLRSTMVTKKAKQTPHPQNAPPVAPNVTWKTPGKLRGFFRVPCWPCRGSRLVTTAAYLQLEVGRKNLTSLKVE